MPNQGAQVAEWSPDAACFFRAHNNPWILGSVSELSHVSIFVSREMSVDDRLRKALSFRS